MKVSKLMLDRCNWVEESLGFDIRFFTPYQMRVYDGDKSIDIYKNRYHKLDTNERGKIKDFEELITQYFLKE